VADLLYPFVVEYNFNEESFIGLFQACNIIFGKEKQTTGNINAYVKRLTKEIRKNVAFMWVPERVDRDFSISKKQTLWTLDS